MAIVGALLMVVSSLAILVGIILSIVESTRKGGLKTVLIALVCFLIGFSICSSKDLSGYFAI